jgi:hypothetical protein
MHQRTASKVHIAVVLMARGDFCDCEIFTMQLTRVVSRRSIGVRVQRTVSHTIHTGVFKREEDEMMKNLSILLLVAFGTATVCLGLSGFLKVQQVQAQRTPVGNNGGKQKWEYCAIVDSYGMDDTNKKPALGYVKIGYFEESGYREETIKVQGDVTGIQPGEVYEKARQKGLGVSIAQLGSQGWEMVGESPFAKRFQSDEKDRTVLYFKRPKS